MSDQSFLLLHGWQNRRPPEHWQHWLAGELTALGHAVDYPQLPDPDYPKLDAWLAELRTRVAAMPATTRRTVLCHSLGCLLWLNAAARSEVPLKVDRVLLVAPPSPSVTLSHPEIAAFAHPPVTPAHLSAAAHQTRLVGTDNDPYFPENIQAVYASLDIPIDVLPGAAHLNMDSGYGPWPSILSWSLSPTDAPLERRPS